MCVCVCVCCMTLMAMTMSRFVVLIRDDYMLAQTFSKELQLKTVDFPPFIIDVGEPV